MRHHLSLIFIFHVKPLWNETDIKAQSRRRPRSNKVETNQAETKTDCILYQVYYNTVARSTAHDEVPASEDDSRMKFGILLAVVFSVCTWSVVMVTAQQYYDEYGEDDERGGVEEGYYQQHDYGGGEDYYGEDGGGGGAADNGGGDSLYQDYAKREQDKAMGKAGGL